MAGHRRTIVFHLHSSRTVDLDRVAVTARQARPATGANLLSLTSPSPEICWPRRIRESVGRHGQDVGRRCSRAGATLEELTKSVAWMVEPWCERPEGLAERHLKEAKMWKGKDREHLEYAIETHSVAAVCICASRISTSSVIFVQSVLPKRTSSLWPVTQHPIRYAIVVSQAALDLCSPCPSIDITRRAVGQPCSATSQQALQLHAAVRILPMPLRTLRTRFAHRPPRRRSESLKYPALQLPSFTAHSSISNNRLNTLISA